MNSHSQVVVGLENHYLALLGQTDRAETVALGYQLCDAGNLSYRCHSGHP